VILKNKWCSARRAAVPLLDADGAFRALVSGFFATAGIFARARIDHVTETVIANLENIRTDILTDTAPGAKIGIDFGNTHGFFLLWDLRACQYKQSREGSARWRGICAS
jgi:hypothetical protein